MLWLMAIEEESDKDSSDRVTIWSCCVQLLFTSCVFGLCPQAVNIDWPPRIDPVVEEDGDAAAPQKTVPVVEQPESGDQQKQQGNGHEATAATEAPP